MLEIPVKRLRDNVRVRRFLYTQGAAKRGRLQIKQLARRQKNATSSATLALWLLKVNQIDYMVKISHFK